MAVVLFGVFYNTLLALINAHVFSVNVKISALSEILIIGYALLLLTKSKFEISDIKEIVLLLSLVVIAILIIIFNQHIYIDTIRNTLIIAVFVMLGKRVDLPTINKIFLITSLIVTAVLLLEMFDLQGYAQLLKPALYYANTRGTAISEFNDTGLFNTALSFEGRFGYGLFNGPRTSSIFLEQVSLSNFAIVLSIFVASLWQHINTKNKLFYIALIITILITSRSRSALGIVLIALVTYQLLPLLNKRLVFLIFPAAILVTLLVYIIAPINGLEDTLHGRLSHTGHLLAESTLYNLFALDINNIGHYADSGIGYVLNAFSLFGMILLWLFVGLVINAQTKEQLRALYLINIYFFATLGVSGTSAFSMKTAALLWLLAGFMSVFALKTKHLSSKELAS